jgi:hypothetical protein
MVWLCEAKTTDELARCCISINKQKPYRPGEGAHLISVSISLSALEYQTR